MLRSEVCCLDPRKGHEATCINIIHYCFHLYHTQPYLQYNSIYMVLYGEQVNGGMGAGVRGVILYSLCIYSVEEIAPCDWLGRAITNSRLCRVQSVDHFHLVDSTDRPTTAGQHSSYSCTPGKWLGGRKDCRLLFYCKYRIIRVYRQNEWDDKHTYVIRIYTFTLMHTHKHTHTCVCLCVCVGPSLGVPPYISRQ